MGCSSCRWRSRSNGCRRRSACSICGFFGRSVDAIDRSDYRPMVMIGLGCCMALAIGVFLGMRLIKRPDPQASTAPSSRSRSGCSSSPTSSPSFSKARLNTCVRDYPVAPPNRRRFRPGAPGVLYPAAPAVLSCQLPRCGLIARRRRLRSRAGHHRLFRRFPRAARAGRSWRCSKSSIAATCGIGWRCRPRRGDGRRTRRWCGWASAATTGGSTCRSDNFKTDRRRTHRRASSDLTSDFFQQRHGQSDGDADKLVDRMWPIYYPALALQRVPAMPAAHQRRDPLRRAAAHRHAARLLSRTRRELPSDSEMVRKYSGVHGCGRETGTSIAFGYAAESYIDFGLPWMFLPVFVFGVLMGMAATRCSEADLASGAARRLRDGDLLVRLYLFERSWATTLGETVGFMVYLGVPNACCSIASCSIRDDRPRRRSGRLLFRSDGRALSLTRVRVLHVSPYFRSGAAVRRAAGIGPRPLPGTAAGRRRRRGGDDDRERRRQPAAVAAGRRRLRRRAGALRRAGVSAAVLRRARARAADRALARADLCHIHGIWNVPEWWASHLARAAGGAVRHLAARACCSRRRCGAAAGARRPPGRCSTRRNLSGAALLHATSEQEAGALRALDLGVPIAVVPNGVDLAGARDARRAASARGSAFPADAFVVLFLGRMHRIKRLDLLAEAFAAAARDASGDAPGAGRSRRARPAAAISCAGSSGARRSSSTRSARSTARDKWALAEGCRRDGAVLRLGELRPVGGRIAGGRRAGRSSTRTCPWSEIETPAAGSGWSRRRRRSRPRCATLAGDPARRAAWASARRRSRAIATPGTRSRRRWRASYAELT